MKEADVNDAEVGASIDVDLVTVSWTVSDNFRKDQHHCNPFFVSVDNSIWGLSKMLSDLKNRPDPPSDPTIRQVANAVREIDAVVSQYAQAGDMTTLEVWKQIGTPRGFRSAIAPAAAPDLTRLRLSGGGRGQRQT